jgi:hypothetical protein
MAATKAKPKPKPKRSRQVTSTAAKADAAVGPGDPRVCPGFQPEYLPLCDGGPPPSPATTDRIERRQIEFAAVYYRLNELFARLEATPRGAAGADGQAIVRAIRQVMNDRDALEDKYEPEGFLGEPVMDGIVYKNIEFTYAPRRGGAPAGSSEFSLFIPLPPRGHDAAAWIAKHLGAAFPELELPARSAKFAKRKSAGPAKRAGPRRKGVQRGR